MNNNEVQTSMMTMMWLLMTCSDDGACMFNSKNAHDLLGNWSSISFRLHLAHIFDANRFGCKAHYTW